MLSNEPYFAITNFPLVKAEIKEFYDNGVTLIDPADETAEQVVHLLKKHKLLTTSKKKPVHQFYVSDFTDAFEKSTRFFFSEAIQLHEARIWK